MNPESAEAWLRPPRPNPHARLRLFCFPHAGAGALSFRPWADLLPPEIGLCPVQFPGRDDRFRELPFTDVHALVQALSRVLYPYQLSHPFAFFGHSMGAIVAFELAHLLRGQYGSAPVHLFVSARIAPHQIDPKPPICFLPDKEFIEQLRTLNGTPEELLREAEPSWMRLLRADFTLNETYRYAPRRPFDVPITVFGGRDDPRVRPADLDQWSEHTCGGFKMRIFDGGHFFVNTVRSEVVQSILLELSRKSNLF